MGKKAAAAAQAENVRVVMRLRNLSDGEKSAGHTAAVSVDHANNALQVTKQFGESERIRFDAVFDNKFSQRDIYLQEAQYLVNAALDGYNATAFAYGQSGTGKTYTMTGVLTDPSKWGLMPQALQQLLVDSKRLETATLKIKISVSFYEIFIGSVKDLLTAKKETLRVKLNAAKTFDVDGLSMHPVDTEDECFRLLEVGSRRRTKAATNLNEDSSRSHAIFTFHVEQYDYQEDPKNPVVCTSKLNIVDLAGSERLEKTGAEGFTAKQGIAINKELSSLSLVIDSLVKGEPPVFRNTNLTMLLMDSLGGTAKTALFATVGPSAENISETMSTVRFALGAKRIKNTPIKHMDPKDATIAELSAKVAELQKIVEDKGLVVNADGTAATSAEVLALEDQLTQAREEVHTLSEDLKESAARTEAAERKLQETKAASGTAEAQVAEAMLAAESAKKFADDRVSELKDAAASVIRRTCTPEVLGWIAERSQVPQDRQFDEMAKTLPAFGDVCESWCQRFTNSELIAAQRENELNDLRQQLQAAEDGLLEAQTQADMKNDELAAVCSKLKQREEELEQLRQQQRDAPPPPPPILAATGDAAADAALLALQQLPALDTLFVSADGPSADPTLIGQLQSQIRLQLELQKIHRDRQSRLETLITSFQAAQQQSSAGNEQPATQTNRQAESAAQLASMKAQLESNAGELHQVTVDASTYRSRCETLAAECEALHSEIATMGREASKSQSQLRTLTEKLNKYKARTTKSEASTASLTAEASQLNNKVNALEFELGEKSSLIDNLRHSNIENRQLTEQAHALLAAEQTTVKLHDQVIRRLREDISGIDDMWKERLEDNAARIIEQHSEKLVQLDKEHRDAIDKHLDVQHSLRKKLRKADDKLQKAHHRFDDCVLENEMLQTQFEVLRTESLKTHMTKERRELESQRDAYRALVGRNSPPPLPF